MRIPIIPVIVVAVVLVGVILLFQYGGGSPPKKLDAPKLDRIADIEGIETEVAVAPDGNRYAVVSDGDLWLVDSRGGPSKRLTETPEQETSPAWTPDGKRLTFTRGGETLKINPDAPASAEPFKANATGLVFAPSGRIAFVRDRGLWIEDPAGTNEHRIVEPSPNPDTIVRSLRFSPDSFQIAFIKSTLGLGGEVWAIDVARGGEPRPLVADRQLEHPYAVDWLMDGREIVYLTDRSGAYALWHLKLSDNLLEPLTAPLVGLPLAPIGISVWKDRIVLPRHFADANIALSDGTTVVAGEFTEFEPAISPDQKTVAYTVQNDNKLEIWTAGIDGGNPTYRTVGRTPRFAPNGFQLVYTNVSLTGNADIWTLDLRTGRASPLTDAGEIDIEPDGSPDGRAIAFASGAGAQFGVWSIPPSGGGRTRMNAQGHFPRFSPDGKRLAYWHDQAIWTVNVSGSDARRMLDSPGTPRPAVFAGKGVIDQRGVEAEIHRPMGSVFDVLRDGRFLIAPITIRETSLWSVELRYKED